MKEKLKQFVAEKRAVSPVIGVVLMVAVVVILAAVIGAFVLGLGGDQQAAPQASFTYDGETLTHDGGDEIDTENIQIIADGADATADWGGNNPISAGDSADVDADETIRIIYDDGSGNTATIATIQVGAGGGGDGGAT